jgi:3-hydroxybutyryl-CoA dehydrogenase
MAYQARQQGERTVERIGVLGAGTMGIGVSQLFAEAEHPVVLVDLTDSLLERARAEIAQNVTFAPLMRPQAPPCRAEDVLERIKVTTDLNELSSVDYVIENVTEDWDIKRQLYHELEEACPAHIPFGVNTSAIPITLVASATRRADRVIGTHFMNPAPLKPTVEVIRGFHTSDETIDYTIALLKSVGKGHVVVNDSPGFITNRVLMLTVNEAIFLLHEGAAKGPDIDRLFKECFGHPMGPLETADLIGLDTVLKSLEVLYGNLNDPKFRPCPLLRTMVSAGLNGRKVGRGFYTYESAIHR